MAMYGSGATPGPVHDDVAGRPTSPDLETDSDDDKPSSESDSGQSSTRGESRTRPPKPNVAADAEGADDQDSFSRNRYDFDAVQERLRVQSLLYDDYAPSRSHSKSFSPPLPVSRLHLRLTVAILRARHSLGTRSFAHLHAAVSEISVLLPGRPAALAAALRRPDPVASITAAPNTNLSGFVPVLTRLVRDVRAAIAAEEDKGREFRRREMSREEAKALVVLRQRWVVAPPPSSKSSSTSSGKVHDRKGKGRASEGVDWVEVVETIVTENPPPACLDLSSLPPEDSFALATSSLLTSIEQVLLPCALPRVSLSRLDLDELDLARWAALREVELVVRWYVSFNYAREDRAASANKAREVLARVRVLDLSHNRLADLPPFLPRLFPNLEAVSLSHNQFTRFPPCITLFSSLRRLGTDRNRLAAATSTLQPKSAHDRGTASTVAAITSRCAAEGARKSGVRANSREVYPFVIAAVRRTVREATCAAELLAYSSTIPRGSRATASSSRLGTSTSEVAPLRSLFSLSAQLAHSQMDRDHDASTWLGASSALPPHLVEAINGSYACASCDRFILPTDSWLVPPFWERVHFLEPGILVPVATKSRNKVSLSRRSKSHNGRYEDDAEEPVEHLDRAGGPGLATLEQRLLLAVLARDHPSRSAEPYTRSRARPRGATRGSLSDYSRCGRQNGRSPGSSSDSTEPEPSQPPSSSSSYDRCPTLPRIRDPPRLPREPVAVTYIVGGRGPHGVGSRYCALCAASHLSPRQEEDPPPILPLLSEVSRIARVEKGWGEEVAGLVAAWACRCEMCTEEKRVRGLAEEEEEEDIGKGRVLRWLRRYP
ncbi:hypothetical protein JCM3774_005276 [Rhodotorula dairenensis]